MGRQETYLNNPNLKPLGKKIAFTAHQEAEMIKCSQDPMYFIENYVKIRNVDDGIVPMLLREYQKDMVMAIHNNRKVIVRAARQIGKTTIIVAYLLYYIIFNKQKVAGVLAQKEQTAKEILHRIKVAYELLPKWMQHGIKEYNKLSIELENGSIVFAAATSANAIRGFAINFLLLDEFAHVGQELAAEFYTSVYPTISSGKTTKIVICSTPKGMNLFYKLWVDAEKKRSDFVPIFVHWSIVPGRDAAWEKAERGAVGNDTFEQEYNCVVDNTIITVRNKETGEIEDVTIGELYARL